LPGEGTHHVIIFILNLQDSMCGRFTSLDFSEHENLPKSLIFPVLLNVFTCLTTYNTMYLLPLIFVDVLL
jgi:hypothetical protein